MTLEGLKPDNVTRVVALLNHYTLSISSGPLVSPLAEHLINQMRAIPLTVRTIILKRVKNGRRTHGSRPPQ